MLDCNNDILGKVHFFKIGVVLKSFNFLNQVSSKIQASQLRHVVKSFNDFDLVELQVQSLDLSHVFQVLNPFYQVAAQFQCHDVLKALQALDLFDTLLVKWELIDTIWVGEAIVFLAQALDVATGEHGQAINICWNLNSAELVLPLSHDCSMGILSVRFSLLLDLVLLLDLILFGLVLHFLYEVCYKSFFD